MQEDLIELHDSARLLFVFLLSLKLFQFMIGNGPLVLNNNISYIPECDIFRIQHRGSSEIVQNLNYLQTPFQLSNGSFCLEATVYDALQIMR